LSNIGGLGSYMVHLSIAKINGVRVELMRKWGQNKWGQSRINYPIPRSKYGHIYARDTRNMSIIMHQFLSFTSGMIVENSKCCWVLAVTAKKSLPVTYYPDITDRFLHYQILSGSEALASLCSYLNYPGLRLQFRVYRYCLICYGFFLGSWRLSKIEWTIIWSCSIV